MQFLLTNAGSAYLAQNPVAPALSQFKLGASYGYTPDPSATAIQGQIVYMGTPSAPFVETANLMRYTIFLSREIGPFAFGEAGLYLPDGTLFAIGVNATPIFKTVPPSTDGNIIALDCYISTDTSVSSSYVSVVNSAQLLIQSVSSVDSLPAAVSTPTNVYLVPSPDGNDATLLAVASSTSWTIEGFSTLVATGHTTSDTPSGSVQAVTWNTLPQAPAVPGQYIVSYKSGTAAGFVRKVSTLTSTTLQLVQGFVVDVPANTQFSVYSAAQLPSTVTTLLSGLDPNLTAAEVNSLHGFNLSSVVKKDGSVTMTSTLNLGGNKLANVGYPSALTDGVNLQALDDLTGALSTAVSQVTSRISVLETTALLKTGVNPLTGTLNANGNKIIKLAPGTDPTDAVSISQLSSYSISPSDLGNNADPNKGATFVGGAIRVLDSIPALRNFPHTGSPRVFVSGYYFVGDGGGGDYYLDILDTTSADDGGSIIVSTDGGRWKLIHSTTISVKQFGARGDGSSNDSTAIQTAINFSGSISFPPGTYLCNVTLNRKVFIRGSGSTASVVMPYLTNIAAMTYAFNAMSNPAPLGYWNYHSTIEGLGFAGNSMVGIGFTFAETDPTVYSANDQFANNVKFYSCSFSGLDKGIQFPFGNIGTEFYSCGWQNNNYGVYSLGNVAFANMHAGNKYFYAGEFHGNNCAVYIYNTSPGFGAFNFKDTIFQFNLINFYCYNTSATFTPPTFNGVWSEASGSISTGASTVTIDQWTGVTKSTITLPKKGFIVDGTNGSYVFDNGFLTDWRIKGSNILVTATNNRAESTSSNSGGSITVDDPVTSVFRIYGSSSNAKTLDGTGIDTDTPNLNVTISSSSSAASGSWWIAKARANKLTNYGTSRVYSNNCLSSISTDGTFSLTGLVVNDGRIYSFCNQFSRTNFGTSEYTRITSSAITTVAAWYVFTFDVKVLAGNLNFFVWDRANSQLASGMQVPSANTWYTLAGYGYSPGGQNLWVDFNGTGVSAQWEVSAVQIHKFSHKHHAIAFLNSLAYTES